MVLKERLPQLLNELKTNYSLVTSNDKVLCSYQNYYFDTSEFELYNAHHNNKNTRFKFRKRFYSTTNKINFEVKQKILKRLNTKHTIEINDFKTAITSKELNYARLFLPNIELEYKLSICYNRISLFQQKINEKITADTDILFTDKNNNTIELKNIAVIEVKQAKIQSSPVLLLFKRTEIKSINFSKYCMAASKLYSLKSNNFKKQFDYIYALNGFIV
ncbi:MAG: VTC domain-containing protein [Bacteroidetes bacterium]|nr:VTC domain-containing protein [Bacteroidota bacterium]